MGKNLQAALERVARPAPTTVVEPNFKQEEGQSRLEAQVLPQRATGRAGKVHIGAWLNPDFKRSLMLVRAQTGKDVQTLLALALNNLFRHHDVPVVDHD